MVRLNSNPTMIDIDQHLGALMAFLASQERIVAAYLYGSYGTRCQTPLSDVDIALLLEGSSLRPGYEDELHLHSDIAQILREEDINLTILNKVPIMLRYNILAEGRLIYRDSSTALEDFIEQTLNTYMDCSIDYRQMARDYDEARLEETYYAR